MFIFNSPLEQFEIFSLYFVHCYKVALTNTWSQNFLYNIFSGFSVSNVLISILILLAIAMFSIQNIFFVQGLLPVTWLRMFYNIFIIIKNIITDLVNSALGRKYYYLFFCVVFFVISFINILGLIPYTFVLTSQFFFTFSLAFFFFITLNLTGIVLHGVKFLQLFYPSGTPLIIVPLLVLIELISYIARVFSLSIRLFANITAGHILVKILSWLTCMISDLLVSSFLSFIVISGLWVLEFFISLLQAYVFLTLLCLYLNDVIDLH
jgi:ATP synthase subunit 6